MNIEKLREEAEQIQRFLEITMSDNANEAVQRGNDLIVYMARTASMLADAKYLLNAAKQDETMQVVEKFILDNKLSAKVQNALIEGLCREQQYLVDWISRLNATCTHQTDWCRTLVSKAKEEMRLTKEFK